MEGKKNQCTESQAKRKETSADLWTCFSADFPTATLTIFTYFSLVSLSSLFSPSPTFYLPLAFPSGFHFPCVSARQFISELFIASVRFTHSRPCCLVDSIMTWDSFSGRRWFRRLIWSMFDGVVDGSFPPRRSCGANRRSRRRYANEHFRHSPVEATAADLIGKLEASVGGEGRRRRHQCHLAVANPNNRKKRTGGGRRRHQCHLAVANPNNRKKEGQGAAASSVPSSGRQSQQSEKRRTGGGGVISAI